jgi:hypothetical protein
LTLPAGISTDWTRTASVVAVGIADIAPPEATEWRRGEEAAKTPEGRTGEEEAKTPTGADTTAATATRTLRHHTEARVRMVRAVASSCCSVSVDDEQFTTREVL